MSIWLLVVGLGLLLTATGGSIVLHAQGERTPSSRQLDQSDPIVLAAVREVDAEFPMLPPLLDQKIRRQDEERLELLAAQEKAKHLETAQREAVWREQARVAQMFFERSHNIPWREDVVRRDGDMLVMKDGRKVLVAAVALYGWDGALAKASS